MDELPDPETVTESQMMKEADADIAKVAAAKAADDAYWAACDVTGTLSWASTKSATAERLYVLWCELTDWWELKPDERPAAEAAMRRAANEWAVAGDDAARAAYLDYWIHDVLDWPRDSRAKLWVRSLMGLIRRARS